MPTPTEVADSLEPDMRGAFLAMIEVVKDQVTAEQLQDLLDRRDFVAIINLFEEVIARSVNFSTTSTISGLYSKLVTQTMTPVLSGTASFNLISQLVLDRIRSSSANLVVGVGQDTISSIRHILSQNYLDGLGAPQAARAIRSVVGLLPQHAHAVGRFSLGLQNTSLPPENRTNLIEQYSQRLLNYRARNISRTETISAAEAGRVAGWVELANKGVLQRHRTRMEWMVTEDDRLCPWCAPMDGQQVGIGDYFISTHKGFPDGKPENRGPGSARVDRETLRPDPRSQPRDRFGRFVSLAKRDQRDELSGRLVELPRQKAVPHPPLHPQCRCTLVLRFED